MSDIRASLQAGRERALRTDQDNDWTYVDRLSIELAKRCTASICDLRVLIDHAIRRNGGVPGEDAFPGLPSETWLEHVLLSVHEGLSGVEAMHSSFETPLMMYSIDHRSRIVGVSQSWCEVLGYSKDEVLGRHTAELLTDESKKLACEIWLPEFWGNGSVVGCEYDYLTKHGKMIPAQLSATSERDKNGVIVRSLAVVSRH